MTNDQKTFTWCGITALIVYLLMRKEPVAAAGPPEYEPVKLQFRADAWQTLRVYQQLYNEDGSLGDLAEIMGNNEIAQNSPLDVTFPAGGQYIAQLTLNQS